MANSNVPQPPPSLTLLCIKTMHGLGKEVAETLAYGINQDRLEAFKKEKAKELWKCPGVRRIRFVYVSTHYYQEKAKAGECPPLRPEQEIV